MKDIGINLALYAPLGTTGYLAFRNQRRRWLAFLIPLLSALLLSGFIEIVQLFDESRDCSASDLLCNLLGTAVGMSFGYLGLTYAEYPRVRAVLRYPDVLLLLIGWLLWQVFPMFPIWHLSTLVDKLRGLVGLHISITDLFTHFAAWLVLALLLERILPRRIVARLLFLLLPLLPAKLLLAGRTMSWSEVIGVLLALLVWNIGLVRLRNRMAWMAGIMVVVLVVRELSPFRWQTSTEPFVWLPFIASLEVDSLSALVILLEKVFFYAAAVWVVWQSGTRLPVASFSCASVLATLEVLQRHLPDRVPESTDPVMAILAGIVLYVFQDTGPLPARYPDCFTNDATASPAEKREASTTNHPGFPF